MRKLIPATLAAIILLTALATALPSPACALDRAASEHALLQLINKARTSRSLAPLRLQAALDESAYAHSREMLARDYFSHDSWNGTGFGTRLLRAGYSRSGWSSWAVGENIGWGRGTASTPQAIFNAWMKSASHRSAILTARWRDVGIGCATGSLGSVTGAVMYTVDFGRRVR